MLWVGKGCSKADYARFFEEVVPSFLTGIIAAAIDMNALYHLVVQEKLPAAAIVYDWYHMQAQFSKEVLGVVRLEETRRHNAQAKALKETLTEVPPEEQKAVKEQIHGFRTPESTLNAHDKASSHSINKCPAIIGGARFATIQQEKN